MKLWMRKIFVVLIAILTLGAYTPTELLEVDAEESNVSNNEEGIEHAERKKAEDPEPSIPSVSLIETNYLNELQNEAKEQSLLKFGPRIREQVIDEFNDVILPEMEKVLENLLPEDEVHYLNITEKPTAGYGERIFNVLDERTNKDVAKFHVRRDHRPLEGYYFNFHYHLSTDNFQTHYQLGEIYWDKNTPPKWMA